MSKEAIQAISDIFLKLRPLLISKMVKPLKDRERCSFPPGYMNVMHCIMLKGREPVSMTDLAMAAGIAKPNLTTIVDRLLEEGLVERSTDANDRRIVNIALSHAGADFLFAQKEDLRKFMEERISNLEEEDLLKLKSALEDIGQVMEKIDR